MTDAVTVREAQIETKNEIKNDHEKKEDRKKDKLYYKYRVKTISPEGRNIPVVLCSHLQTSRGSKFNPVELTHSDA